MAETKLNDNQASSNLYTKFNLFGGKNCEIVPEPVEGGVDENTVACWHFDGDTNWIDDRGTVYQTDFSYQNLTLKTNFKFGTGSAAAPNNAGAKFSCATLENNYGRKRLSMNSSFTLDFWFLFGDNGESNTSISNFGFTGSTNGFYWGLVKDLTQETTFHTNVAGVAYQTKFVPTEKGLVKNTWHHIAMEYYVIDDSTGTSTFYIDGNPVASIDFTVGSSAVLDTFQFGGRSGQIFDEVRISNIARYKGQPFTPPTKAYEVAKPTGNMVVNCLFSVESVMPDYSTFTTIAASTNFEAPSAGYISYVPSTNTDTSSVINVSSNGYISIAGKTVLQTTYAHGSDSGHIDGGLFPIDKGESAFHTMNYGTVYFYSAKGVSMIDNGTNSGGQESSGNDTDLGDGDYDDF